jgi:hypothetical protein
VKDQAYARNRLGFFFRPHGAMPISKKWHLPPGSGQARDQRVRPGGFEVRQSPRLATASDKTSRDIGKRQFAEDRWLS